VVPLPATEKLPTPHTPLPLELLQPLRQYLPPSHGLQILLFANANVPAGQKSIGCDNPSEEQNFPASHGLHEDVFAPKEEYDPTGHKPEMKVNPVSTQYFPGSHGLQLLESAASW
jgi:hypothetical protein